MIRRTFLLLPSIGEITERSLWRKGIDTWDDFIESGDLQGFSRHRKARLDARLREAEEFLSAGETGYFTSMLPPSEHWRLLNRFKGDTAYLDIETDGLGHDARITVVGVHRNGRTNTLVRGQDLTTGSLRKHLEGCKVLVTFNGASFDLPILQHSFPFSVPRIPHVDLCHACSRIGLRGGLKIVERKIGLGRPQEVDYVTGEEAGYLWKLWENKGRENALRLLLRYNMEDTRNLEPLANYVYERLEAFTLSMAMGDDRDRQR